ncbi:MAG TPA: NAD(P)H-hydrate epimerase [Planctomycetaceae bacterium]|jgi:NAD(P)H-hydrate epimerase|nr:NAD(P)H-hydrate epimerase [Planctomycetaceae bacterium]
MRSLTRAEVRDVDRRAIEDYGLPGVVLMENAGRNAAAVLLSQGITGPVAICCGKGNNGGDGFVIARHLDNAGIAVKVLLTHDPLQYTGDAAVFLNVIQRARLPLCRMPDSARNEWQHELQSAEWIVDALLGTGLTGEVREPYITPINAINVSGKNVFAIDLPSGMDTDTGQPLGTCVRATRTVTFVARKIGFDQPGAEQWTGSVDVVDIGVPRALLSSL